MKSNRMRDAVLAGLLAGVLASCTSGGAAPVATTSAPSSPSPTPTPTPTPATPEQQAAADAEPVLRAYFKTITACLADPPNTPATCFDEVTTATERNDNRNALTSAQLMGTKAVGSIEVVSVEVESVDLTNDVAASPPRVPIVTFRVCRDISGFDMVDQEGQSAMSPDRVLRAIEHVHVANYAYPDATQWRVAYLTTPEPSTTC